MKTRLIAVAGFAFLLGAALTVGAQELPGAVVKVLPTAAPDAIKLLVVQNDDKSVDVKFYNDAGLIAGDEIRAAKAGSGFIKRYEFQKLFETDFWMSVNTSSTRVVYKITRDAGRIDAQLTETTHTYPVAVASR